MTENLQDERLREFEEALLGAARIRARAILHESVAAGDTSMHSVETLIVPALERIGAEWADGRVALSQVYMAGRMCEELVDGLMPPQSPERRSQPRMAIAVLHDRHMLGKRLVYSVLRSAGYALLDYGAVSVDELVARATAEAVDVLLISVLMLPSALKIKDVRAAFDRTGVRPAIVVGGAPFRFDPGLGPDVGADAVGLVASDVLPIVAGIGAVTSAREGVKMIR